MKGGSAGAVTRCLRSWCAGEMLALAGDAPPDVDPSLKLEDDLDLGRASGGGLGPLGVGVKLLDDASGCCDVDSGDVEACAAIASRRKEVPV